MFTGIITANAKIHYTSKRSQGLEVSIAIPKGWNNLVIGESIAVNGACLTIVSINENDWTAFLMPETLNKTSFQHLRPQIVNLERALPLNERLSGHIVQGHVDTVGKVSNIDMKDGYRISIKFPSKNATMVIPKGSVTIDGVSLTISNCSNDILEVALIPHTLSTTTLGSLRQDDTVNIEFDIIGKYVTRFLTQENHANNK